MPRSTFSKGAGGTPRGGGSGIELTIEGQGLAVLQRKLRAMPSGKELTREMNKGLRDVARAKLVPAVHEAARDNLPRRGGFAERVAGLPVKVRVRSGNNPGVILEVKGTEAKASDRGIVRHPVFGNRNAWVTQKITPGWFSRRMKREAPVVRAKLVEVLEHIANKIARS